MAEIAGLSSVAVGLFPTRPMSTGRGLFTATDTLIAPLNRIKPPGIATTGAGTTGTGTAGNGTAGNGTSGGGTLGAHTSAQPGAHSGTLGRDAIFQTPKALTSGLPGPKIDENTLAGPPPAFQVSLMELDAELLKSIARLNAEISFAKPAEAHERPAEAAPPQAQDPLAPWEPTADEAWAAATARAEADGRHSPAPPPKQETAPSGSDKAAAADRPVPQPAPQPAPSAESPANTAARPDRTGLDG